MSIFSDARQYSLTAVVDIVAADIVTTAVPVTVLNLPLGTVITSIVLFVDTAFDTGTTADLDIGDNTDPNRYTQTIAEIDAAGIPANPPLVDYYETTLLDTDLIITPTLTGIAMVAGAARLIVEYYVAGRQNENRG